MNMGLETGGGGDGRRVHFSGTGLNQEIGTVVLSIYGLTLTIRAHEPTLLSSTYKQRPDLHTFTSVPDNELGLVFGPSVCLYVRLVSHSPGKREKWAAVS